MYANLDSPMLGFQLFGGSVVFCGVRMAFGDIPLVVRYLSLLLHYNAGSSGYSYFVGIAFPTYCWMQIVCHILSLFLMSVAT
jgi:hypothetical protein